ERWQEGGAAHDDRVAPADELWNPCGTPGTKPGMASHAGRPSGVATNPSTLTPMRDRISIGRAPFLRCRARLSCRTWLSLLHASGRRRSPALAAWGASRAQARIWPPGPGMGSEVAGEQRPEGIGLVEHAMVLAVESDVTRAGNGAGERAGGGG